MRNARKRVHQATIVITVLDEQGHVAMEGIVDTKRGPIVDFLQGLSGRVEVTFEEGTQAAWLYDIVKPRVAKVVVCDPRRNKLLKAGSKADKVDSRKLAELLRAGLLNPVYHGEHGTRALKELAHSYGCLVQDCTRVMNRLKAIFRGRGIRCAGRGIYRVQQKAHWLDQLSEPGVRRRAEYLYVQLEGLQALRKQARQAMLAESRKHQASRILGSVASLGPVRVAQIIAKVDTPHRFRTKRQFWAYVRLAVVTKASAEYVVVQGKVRRVQQAICTRGLNRNCNYTLKQVFKSAAASAAARGPFKAYYGDLLAKGMRPEMARLTVARKIAAITLRLWKNAERFDAEKLMPQAA